MFGTKFQNEKGSYSQKASNQLLSIRNRVPKKKREHYDFTSFAYRKRLDVVLNGVEELKKQLAGICEDTLIEAYFALTNSLFLRGGYYDTINVCNQVALSAAIWILDQLTLQGKLEECFPYLPIVDANDYDTKIILPYVNHPMYDFSLILSMVMLIRQRNTSVPFSNDDWGMLVWEKEKPDNDDESVKNRSAFDAVIDLLDKKAIERAVETYEDDVWNFYRLAFRTYSMMEKRTQELEKELDRIENQALKKLDNLKQTSLLSLNANKNPKQQFETFHLDESGMRRIERIHDEIEMLYDTTFTELSLANDREKTARKLKKVIPDDLAYNLIHFHVNDPFETSFAILYSMDNGSRIPWFYYGSMTVAYTMCDQLPYDAQIMEIEAPVLLSDYNDALYKHEYSGYRWPENTDASGDPVQREFAKNLGQLLFSNSMTLFPRVTPKVSFLESYLENLGDLSKREKEVYSLLLYALRAQTLKVQGLSEFQLMQSINGLIETEQFKDDDVDIELQNNSFENEKLIKQLRSKNEQLLSILKENSEKNKKLTKQNEVLTTATEIQRRELADLREKVFLLEQNESSGSIENDKSSKYYPYITNKRIVSYGGHQSWINEMKKKLPNVIFVSPENLPNVELIRYAEEIWIQTNCISHSSYYKIMDTLKSLGKQVRYYIYPGVNMCADQIVESCESGIN